MATPPLCSGTQGADFGQEGFWTRGGALTDVTLTPVPLVLSVPVRGEEKIPDT